MDDENRLNRTHPCKCSKCGVRMRREGVKCGVCGGISVDIGSNPMPAEYADRANRPPASPAPPPPKLDRSKNHPPNPPPPPPKKPAKVLVSVETFPPTPAPPALPARISGQVYADAAVVVEIMGKGWDTDRLDRVFAYVRSFMATKS